MALTVGYYVWPGQAHAVAVAAVVVLTAVNYVGLQKSVWLTREIVAVVLAVLIAVVSASLSSGTAQAARLGIGTDATFGGVLQAAGLLFFAFAGYARIATLGEEVRDPKRIIPRAIPLAPGITLVVYAAVAVAALSVLGADRLAHSAAPLADAVRAAGVPSLAPVVRVGAAVAALGSLLALILGCHAPPWRWHATGTCPTSWPPSTPASGFRTAPSSWSVWWSPSWPPPLSAGCNRLLLLRRAGLLRHRQRLSMDAHPGRRPSSPSRADRRRSGLLGPGLLAAARLGAVGSGRDRDRRRRVRPAQGIGPPRRLTAHGSRGPHARHGDTGRAYLTLDTALEEPRPGTPRHGGSTCPLPASVLASSILDSHKSHVACKSGQRIEGRRSFEE